MWAAKAFALVVIAAAAMGQAPVKGPQAVDALPLGDAARGQALFEGRGECLGCHRVRDKGSRFGPDLTDIGSRAGVLPARGAAASPFAPIPPDIGPVARAQAELTRALVDPAAGILPQNRTVRLITSSGETTTARVLNLDTFSLQVIARSGTLLWKAMLGGNVVMGPMSYAVAGKQYVAVAAGNPLFVYGLR